MPAAEASANLAGGAGGSRHWRLALAAGLAIGLLNAVSEMMWGLSARWALLATAMVWSVTLAVVLVPCIALAGRLRADHPARPGAFVAAGIVASLVAIGVDIFLLREGLDTLDVPRLTYFWTQFPPLATGSVLAALGYMHWVDTGRRAEALHDLKLQHARFAREAFEARLAALQARVEPAFLFETLSAVEKLYQKDAASAASVLEALIVHLRAALPEIEDVSSSLAVEVTLVRTWLDIMHARSGARVPSPVVTIDAPLDARMPPMVLLPLVQHAVGASGGTTCAILIAATCDGARVTVGVTAPAPAFRDADTSSTRRELAARLEALYGDAAKLVLEELAHDRSRVILEIPYERTDRRPR